MEKNPSSRNNLTEAGFEEQKRLLYEGLPLRRRKFVDRLGFAAWDPFAAPKEPQDMRRYETAHMARRLAQAFFLSREKDALGADYERAALDCAAGLIAGEERYRGILDFCLWYAGLAEKNSNPAPEKIIP